MAKSTRCILNKVVRPLTSSKSPPLSQINNNHLKCAGKYYMKIDFSKVLFVSPSMGLIVGAKNERGGLTDVIVKVV